MIKKILVLLFLISFSTPFFGQNTLKVMTFNCEFMWDGIHPEEGKIEFEHKGNQELAEKHMEHLANVIIRNNPDIVNLVETEGLSAVSTFNEKFLKDQGYKVYFEEGIDTYTGQDVALLSRVDIQNFGRYGETPYCGLTSKRVSKNYFAMLEVYNTKIALISLHFLSRPTAKDRIPKREAQAATIKQLAVSLDDLGYNIIMFGDFNDFDGDADCLDINGNKPTSKVLWSLKKLNGADEEDDLINVASKVKQEERYTAHYDKNENNTLQFPKEVSAIDHILISKKLEGNITEVKYDHEHDPLEVSDHFPIVLTLDFK